MSIIQKKELTRIKHLKFYNVMIDESTDQSMTNHLVVFIMFVEGCMLQCVFLGPLHIDAVRKCLSNLWNPNQSMKEQGLDINKCVALVMNMLQQWLAKRWIVWQHCLQCKVYVNLFISSIHCVTHILSNKTQLTKSHATWFLLVALVTNVMSTPSK